ETMAILEAYAWPGNIRQLQNVLEVALALLDEDEDCILPAHLPEDVVQDADDAPVDRPVARVAVAVAAEALARGRGRRPKDIDDATIRAALERFDGNLSAAARHLGVARNTLYRRMGCDF
ncbi:MAG: sigma-54-dependent Fis family transcriptional regulator, partial [Thauera sp.]|nr:sigma-54-dependent Fis family transcriptional regulator [Thauera sp.]